MPTSFFNTFNHYTLEDDAVAYYPDSIESVLQKLDQANTNDSSFANFSIELRISLFNEIIFALQSGKDELHSLYCRESGLSEKRFNIEFERVIYQLEHFVSFLKNVNLNEEFEKKVINGKEISFKRSNEPIGKVLVIGASNFPLAYSAIGGDVVSALAAGCPVIYKAHPYHIGTSLFVAKLIETSLSRLSLSPGLYIHYTDNQSNTVTKSILLSGQIDAVGFTGSQSVGRYLMDLCAALPCPIPVFAEMGSLNPVVLCSKELENNEQKYADLLAVSITNDAGQFCTKPGLIIYPKNELGEVFKEKLIHAVAQQPHFHMLHPIIHDRYQKSVNSLSKQTDAEVLLSQSGSNSMHGEKVLLKVSTKSYIDNSCFHEEAFGPFALLVEYFDERDLVPLLSSLNGQLTGTIIANEHDQALPNVISILRKKCGRLILNSVPTGVNVLSTMHHGGPYPSSSDSRFTAVGQKSVFRFVRPITFQNF